MNAMTAATPHDHPAGVDRSAGHSAERGGHERGALAREQLLAQATRIFAAKGFAAASTREICEAAGVNVAAIHYYYGDKEGLYRAVLLRPIAEMTQSFGAFDDPTLPFEHTMRMFIAPFLAMADDEQADLEAQVMRLHLREMIEPSAVFREVTEQTIVPVHLALCRVIARHCGPAGPAGPDADIHQLAFAMVAMANDYCMSREFMKMLAPQVLDRPQAMALALDRLVGYCGALLDHEIARRGWLGQASGATTGRQASIGKTAARKPAAHERVAPASTMRKSALPKATVGKTAMPKNIVRKSALAKTSAAKSELSNIARRKSSDAKPKNRTVAPRR